MKIAVLYYGSTTNRKGAFNNVLERIKHIKEVDGVTADSYLIRPYDSWFFNCVRENKETKEETSLVDGISYRNLWVKHKMWDYYITYKLKQKDISCKSQLNQFVPLFKNYDLLSVHSLQDMYLAYLVKQKYGIPYVITWHGSDINVWPFVNTKGFTTTKLVLEHADYNFFVSKKLLEVSDKIAKTTNKDYLYTGPSANFQKLDEKEVQLMKEHYSISSKYVIGFIGNLISIKNVLVLPEILRLIQDELTDVGFVVVGDGKLEQAFKKKMAESGIEKVSYVGKLEPETMPEIMNCMDVLLLPSKNEGMPRVCLEALACGVHVVGSDVGGIPESIGLENAFSLQDDFVKKVSNRVISIIANGEKTNPLSQDFSWESAILKEMDVYKQVLNR